MHGGPLGEMVGRVDQPGGRFGLARLLPRNRQAGEVSVVLWHDARLVTSKAGSWVGMELHLCAGRPTLNQWEAARLIIFTAWGPHRVTREWLVGRSRDSHRKGACRAVSAIFGHSLFNLF